MVTYMKNIYIYCKRHKRPSGGGINTNYVTFDNDPARNALVPYYYELNELGEKETELFHIDTTKEFDAGMLYLPGNDLPLFSLSNNWVINLQN